MADEEQTRVVIDTNILVGSAWSPNSASGRIVAAVREQEMTMIVSAAILVGGRDSHR